MQAGAQPASASDATSSKPPSQTGAAKMSTSAPSARAASDNPVAQEAAASKARNAADATTLETVTILDREAPEDDVPPATADSPKVRQAWLDRIGELIDAGRIDEAKASLAEFRRRYPNAALPPEVQALEP